MMPEVRGRFRGGPARRGDYVTICDANSGDVYGLFRGGVARERERERRRERERDRQTGTDADANRQGLRDRVHFGHTRYSSACTPYNKPQSNRGSWV